jgi:hypothetical protein
LDGRQLANSAVTLWLTAAVSGTATDPRWIVQGFRYARNGQGAAHRAGSVTTNAHVTGKDSRLTTNRHNRPIGAHFHSGGVEFSYFGQDFDEAFG